MKLDNYELNTNNRFTGKLKQYDKNGRLESEFKISDGFRNGKSIYYNEVGSILKTEKYTKGNIN